MTQDIAIKFSMLAVLIWIAFSLTFCSGAAAPAAVKITPAPVVVYSTQAAGAPKPPPERRSWIEASGNLLGALLPYATLIVVGAIVIALVTAGWTQVQGFVAALLGDGDSLKAGGALLTVGATAYSAFKSELGEQSTIIVLIGGVILLMPLAAARFNSLPARLAAILAMAVLLIGIPALALVLWPFFTETGPDKIKRAITGYQAAINSLEEVKVETVLNVSLLFVIYALNAGLVLFRKR